MPVPATSMAVSYTHLDVYKRQGLNPAEDEILEAAIVTTDGDILFESRFKPACVTEWPKAHNVNGISPEMVADAPGIIDKIGEMAALLQNRCV